MQYLYYRMIKKTNTDTQTTPDVPNHTIMFYCVNIYINKL